MRQTRSPHTFSSTHSNPLAKTPPHVVVLTFDVTMPAAKKNLKAANRCGNSVKALTRRLQKFQVGPQVQHQQDSSAEEEDPGSADGSDSSEDWSDGSEEEMDWEKSYWNLKKENASGTAGMKQIKCQLTTFIGRIT
jgi:hypothetical protein